MAANKGLMIGLVFALLVAWAFLMVAATDGPYTGWFKFRTSATITAEAGWKGYVVCDGNYNNCGSGTDYQSGTCYTDGMKAAGAFTIIAIVFGFAVLVSAFMTAFQLGPPFYHFNKGTMAMAFATSVFALLAWTVALGRVFHCTDPYPDVDYSPPFLIVAQVIYLVVGIMHFFQE